MVAYYILMAFKQRDVCLAVSPSDPTQTENMSRAVTASFIAGFVLHLINFTVGTFVEPCVRLISLSSPRKAEEPSHSNWFMIGYSADAIFRLSFVVFSIG